MINNRDYHLFEVHGDRIFSLPSGELFRLDDLAWDLLKSGAATADEAIKALKENYPAGDVEEAFNEMALVLSRPVKDHRNDTPPRKLRALCLNITHKCNLACRYCFAEKLTAKTAPSMSSEVVKQSFDFLFKESEGVERLQVDFFGGEPLLVFDKVREGIEYARKLEKIHGKRVMFTVTTNAVLLDEEKIRFLKDNSVSLILSLDGDRETNDVNRKNHSGGGSYEKVIANIRKVASIMDPKDYYVRGTFTSKSLDILKTLKYYHSEGFYNVSLEPVSLDKKEPESLKKEHLDEIIRNYQDAAQWMVGKDLSFFHFNLEMDNPLCLTRRITGCGAGVEYMAVDPKGDLYPCHQFVEEKEFRLGNVFEGIENKKLSDKFSLSTIYTKEGCSKCWGRFYCGGGCHFRQYLASGDFNKPEEFDCELFLKRLETALWFNVKRKEFKKVRIK